MKTPASLKERLINLIRTDGPVPISVFMQLALFDKKQGYYATRPGLGTDFTTSPEISQIFGEMLGLWAVHEWRQMGAPASFNLIELGPGRGVMAADIWRATQTAPDFQTAARFILVEASPTLRDIQKEKLASTQVEWADTLVDTPKLPTLILSNEMLDCLPIRQFVRKDGHWCERLVGLSDDSQLILGLSNRLAPEDTPSSLSAALQDEVEFSPALDPFAQEIGDYLKSRTGRALFIDYGPAKGRPGDTLRAYRDGAQVDPLSSPAATDITADVDFEALVASAQKHGLDVSGPTPQGWLLNSLGAVERVNALMNANPGRAEDIAERARRIMAPEEMGERFKAVCLSSKGLPPPAGF